MGKGTLAKLRKYLEYHIGFWPQGALTWWFVHAMFVLCSVMVCVGGIEVDQLNALCVWSYQVSVDQACNCWSGTHSVAGIWHECKYHGGYWLRYWGITGGTGGTGVSQGGTEVCVGGRTGVGVSPPCINYTGKKPARTQKLSVMMAIMKN